MKREEIIEILKNVWGTEWDTLTEAQQEKRIKSFIKRQQQYDTVDAMAKRVFKKGA